jgi:hypothetical protein
MTKTRPLLCASVIALAFSLSAAQAQTMPEPVSAWYVALKKADAAGFAALLSDKAVIDLKQLGVTQTKAEFIESLDAWKDAVAGAEISVSAEADGSFAVCYKFPSNERLNREQFEIVDGKVTRQTQEMIAETCTK